MSLRIAMVGACPYPAPQGSQALIRSTALALRELGHDVHLVVYSYGVGLDATGLPIHRSAAVPGARKTSAGPSLAKPFQDLALVRTLKRVIDDQRIEVVHAHNYEALLVALAGTSLPIIYHAHNAMADELPHFIAGTQSLGAWLDKTFPRRAAHVLAPHQVLADYLVVCGCAEDHVSVIPPSTDVAFTQAPTTVADVPPVVYAGNLDAYQNLELLRKAMERVRHTKPHARLLVATADRRPCLWAERIETPDVAALRNVLARDVVVACPRVSWSGYPMKLLNAMAAGRPCVACRSAAHPLEHERTGLVVEDNDPEAFASALLRLMDDAALRRSLGAAARAAVESKHSPETVAPQIDAVYRRVLTFR